MNCSQGCIYKLVNTSTFSILNIAISTNKFDLLMPVGESISCSEVEKIKSVFDMTTIVTSKTCL